MMKIYCALLISLMMWGTAVAQEEVYIEGQIWEEGEQDILIGTTLIFLQNGVEVKGTNTDIEGNFFIWLKAGVYDLRLSYYNCPDKLIKNLVAESDLREPLKIVYTSCKDTPPIVEDPNTRGNTIIPPGQIRTLPQTVAKLNTESLIIPAYSFTLSDPPVSIKRYQASTSAITGEEVRYQAVKTIADLMFYFPGMSTSQ